MNIGSYLRGVASWFAGLFRSVDKSVVYNLLSDAADIVETALPIVQAIDRHIKPILHSGPDVDLAINSLELFLREFGYTVQEEAREMACKLVALPWADMLAGLAIAILRRISADEVSLSMARLAVELAYNIHKGLTKR